MTLGKFGRGPPAAGRDRRPLLRGERPSAKAFYKAGVERALNLFSIKQILFQEPLRSLGEQALASTGGCRLQRGDRHAAWSAKPISKSSSNREHITRDVSERIRSAPRQNAAWIEEQPLHFEP